MSRAVPHSHWWIRRRGEPMAAVQEPAELITLRNSVSMDVYTTAVRNNTVERFMGNSYLPALRVLEERLYRGNKAHLSSLTDEQLYTVVDPMRQVFEDLKRPIVPRSEDSAKTELKVTPSVALLYKLIGGNYNTTEVNKKVTFDSMKPFGRVDLDKVVIESGRLLTTNLKDMAVWVFDKHLRLLYGLNVKPTALFEDKYRIITEPVTGAVTSFSQILPGRNSEQKTQQ